MAQIEIELSLPTDARFVQVLRRVADSLLEGLEVPRESIDDVTVALSEACGNVIRHASETDEYAVRLRVGASCCRIEVSDLGPGIDAVDLTASDPEVAESGRGMSLIEALMDDMQFSRDERTTTVMLVKRWESVGLGPVLNEG